MIQQKMFAEAKNVAIESKFPPNVIAEISKKHADDLYNNKEFNEALSYYIKTIGFLNPGYVI